MKYPVQIYWISTQCSDIRSFAAFWCYLFAIFTWWRCWCKPNIHCVIGT